MSHITTLRQTACILRSDDCSVFVVIYVLFFVCTLITNNTSEICHYDLCCFLLIGYDEVFIVYTALLCILRPDSNVATVLECGI